MELIRNWILSVTAAAMVLSVAEAVMPDGTVKKVGKRVGGLVLILALLQPLVSLDYESLYEQVSRLPAEKAWQETEEKSAMEPMKAVIEQKLSAYIVDKAAESGVSCTAEVRCTADENHVPVPTEVILTGNFTEVQKQVLTTCLEQELGIEQAHQIFCIGGAP